MTAGCVTAYVALLRAVNSGGTVIYVRHPDHGMAGRS